MTTAGVRHDAAVVRDTEFFIMCLLCVWQHDHTEKQADSNVAQVVLTDINKRWGDVCARS